jgi:hypothetical protein
VPAILLLLSPAAEAAKKEKAKPAAAKKKEAPSKASKSADSAVVAAPGAANQAWETPPSGDLTKLPPPPPPSPPPAETKPETEAAPAAAPAAVPAAESPPIPSPTQPAAPSPAPEEEAMPAFIPQPPPPPPQYVEHLGPISYPGKLRGLYGGSLWLEPSFHGLQWPYMVRTGVGISGSAWVDTGYETNRSESSSVPNSTTYLQQARAVLRVTPTYVSGRFFVQAQAELVGNGCQTTGTTCLDAGTVSTDDLWLRIGEWNVWDLKVGRFEGWEVFHTGMGLDINTFERMGAWATSGSQPPDYYGVSFLHDRPQALGQGYAAAHYYPFSFLRFELQGELGTSAVKTAGNNVWGGRSVAIFDLGWLKLKAGAEYDNTTDTNTAPYNADPAKGPTGKVDDGFKQTRKGYGGAAQFVYDPYVEVGASIAQGIQTYNNPQANAQNATNSFTKTSLGGFANVRVVRLLDPDLHILDDLLLGGGVVWTTDYNNHRVNSPDGDYSAHLQIFGAIQYLIAKQLFVKGVFAYARGDFKPSGAVGEDIYSNEMYSFRLRLMYLY